VSATENHYPDMEWSTASAQVHVIEPDFFIPGLNRDRTVRVYLPPDYQQSNKRYPVLYMHDGQNLFDEATAYSGEWRVDKSLNLMAHHQELELIVVGIDNGKQHRITELSAWDHETYGKAEGQLYLDFIVQQLIPHVNQHYRTISDREYTGIMGSSMGGLMSHFAIHRYPQVFSKAGILSPSFWYSHEVFSFTRQQPIPADSRLYFLMGNEEDKAMVDDMHHMVNQIADAGHPYCNLVSKTVPGRGHSESFWAEEFPKAVKWLFGEPV